MCAPLAALAPIIGGALAGGGSAIAGAVGSENARAAQGDQIAQAMGLQGEMWRQNREDALRMWERTQENIAPWLEAGRGSLGELLRQMQAGEFDQQFNASHLAEDPGFQFRMAEGQKALERSAAARGGLNSGGFMKGLARYSQGVASDEFQNAWARNQSENTGRYNRLAAMAGIGQTAGQNLGQFGSHATSHLGQLGSGFANQMTGLYGSLGNANAAGSMGIANAISGGLGTIGNGMTLAGLYNAWGGGGGGGMSIPTQAASGPAFGGYVPSASFGLNYGG